MCTSVSSILSGFAINVVQEIPQLIGLSILFAGRAEVNEVVWLGLLLGILLLLCLPLAAYVAVASDLSLFVLVFANAVRPIL